MAFPRKHPGWTDEHEQLRRTVRGFVEREITPNINEWEEAGGFPRELYTKAAELDLLGLGFPEAYGGTPVDAFARLLITEELCRAGSGGVIASLMSHGIGLPPIIALGSESLKKRIAPPVIAGEQIIALAKNTTKRRRKK